MSQLRPQYVLNMARTERADPTEEVYVVLEKGHEDGLILCDVCGTLTTKGYQRFEQWGSKIRVIAEEFPTYTCPNDGIVLFDGAASLEFLQKELAVFREQNDRGFRQITREAIRLAQRNLRLNKE